MTRDDFCSIRIDRGSVLRRTPHRCGLAGGGARSYSSKVSPSGVATARHRRSTPGGSGSVTAPPSDTVNSYADCFFAVIDDRDRMRAWSE